MYPTIKENTVIIRFQKNLQVRIVCTVNDLSYVLGIFYETGPRPIMSAFRNPLKLVYAQNLPLTSSGKSLLSDSLEGHE